MFINKSFLLIAVGELQPTSFTLNNSEEGVGRQSPELRFPHGQGCAVEPGVRIRIWDGPEQMPPEIFTDYHPGVLSTCGLLLLPFQGAPWCASVRALHPRMQPECFVRSQGCSAVGVSTDQLCWFLSSS